MYTYAPWGLHRACRQPNGIELPTVPLGLNRPPFFLFFLWIDCLQSYKRSAPKSLRTFDDQEKYFWHAPEEGHWILENVVYAEKQ